MAHDREVAGLRCTDLLGLLSDYLDGELPAETVQHIEAHLRGCDWCEHFGAEMSGVVAALRRELAAPSPLESDADARLRARLDRELP